MKFKSDSKKHLFLVNSALVITALIWGSTFFTAKEALNSASPLGINFYRCFISSIIFLPIFLLLRKNLLANFKWGVLVGSLVFAGFTTQTIGLQYTSASNSGFFTGMFAIFVPLFSVIFWRVKLGLDKIIAILLALVGLWFATGGIQVFNIGDLLNLSGAMFWALYIIAADKAMKKGCDPWVLNFQQFLVMGFLSLLLALLFRQSLQVTTHKAWYIVIYLAIFANVIAYSLQFIAQKYAAPTVTGLILSLEPIFAATFAWTLGNDIFSWTKLSGGILIVIAIIFCQVPILELLKEKRSMWFKD